MTSVREAVQQFESMGVSEGTSLRPYEHLTSASYRPGPGDQAPISEIAIDTNKEDTRSPVNNEATAETEGRDAEAPPTQDGQGETGVREGAAAAHPSSGSAPSIQLTPSNRGLGAADEASVAAASIQASVRAALGTAAIAKARAVPGAVAIGPDGAEIRTNGGEDGVNDIEKAIKACKELEFIMRTDFGSRGKDLHQLVKNCSQTLPMDLVMNMRYVATIADNIAYQKDFNVIPNHMEYDFKYSRALKVLREISRGKRELQKKKLDEMRRLKEQAIEKELAERDAEVMRENAKLMEARKIKMAEEEIRRKKAAEEWQKRTYGLCSCL